MNTFDGILFIGDPHVSSRRPGRRKDDYLSSVLNKLREAAAVCREQRLLPVILGDLFNRNDDNDLRMLNRLVAVLKEYPVAPFVLEGNHDKEQTTLSEADALTLLASTGVVRLLNKAGLEIEVPIAEQGVCRLIAFPYGSPLPDAVERRGDWTIAVTHHDLAFGSSYPGAQPLKPIENVDLVVNGHMHDTKAAQQHGNTWWHNPGNIEPLSVDLANHVPRVWRWCPSQGVSKHALAPIELTHGTDLFDLTGIQVAAASAEESVAALAPQKSEFAALLEEEAALQAQRTEDGSIFLEDLKALLDEASVSKPAAALLLQLAASVTGNPENRTQHTA